QYEPEVAARAKEACLRESRRYLETLVRKLAVPDVEISSSVACESPLYESIVHTVRRCRPDLVIRGAAAAAPLDPKDWELIRACPAPLLLTRGQPWKPQPIVAAAVDVSAGESEELTRTILRTAAGLAKAAAGSVEIMHGGRFDTALPPAFDACRAALAARVKDAGLEGAECHLLDG